MVVHRQQTEKVVVVLGDRLTGPVLVDRADLELLITTPELHTGHRARPSGFPGGARRVRYLTSGLLAGVAGRPSQGPSLATIMA